MIMNLIATIIGIFGTVASLHLGDYGLAAIQAVIAVINLHFYQTQKDEQNGK